MKSFVLILFLISCSSVDKHQHLKKDYKVVDASLDYRPLWLKDLKKWVKKNHKKDQADYEYYIYETEPQLDRELACGLAKAKVKAPIVSQISSNVKVKFTAEKASQALGTKAKGVRSSIENKIKERVSAQVSGVKEVASYWERRKYSDSSLYTCASLVRIKKTMVDTIIERTLKEYGN